MTTLQKIVKAAKALKKKYPNKYSKWTDYVKAASKTVKLGKKVGAVKKKALPKKAAPKKKAPARSSHKDTKSHNVNIRVMSGVDKKNFESNLLKIKNFASIVSTLGYLKVSPFAKDQKMWLEQSAKATKILYSIDRQLIKDNYYWNKYLNDAITSYNYWKA